MFNRYSKLVVVLALASLITSCASMVDPSRTRGADGGIVTDGGSGRFDAGSTRVVCLLSTGGTCEVGHVCDSGPCNTCDCQADGTCRWSGCGPDASVDAATRTGCRSDAECGANESCFFPATGCGIEGTCGGVAECYATILFCGCDGATFRDCPGHASRPWVPVALCEARPPVFQCDPSRVGCGGVDPPVCPAGMIASIEGTCWGPCVPIAACGAIPCGDLVESCPSGMHCPFSTDGGAPTCVPN